MNAVHDEMYKGYRIKIHQDDDAENPREQDNIGCMLAFHSRYTLGDKNLGYTKNDFESLEDMEQRLREDGAVICLPLVLYDHSGITIKVGTSFAGDEQMWDTSRVGFIYATKRKLLEEYGKKGGKITKAILKKGEAYLRGEVEQYNNYLTGDVFGFTIEDPNGVEQDSCWGFNGDWDGKNYGALREARAVIDSLVKNTKTFKVRVEVVTNVELRAANEKDALESAKNLVKDKLGTLVAELSPFVES